MAYNAGEAFLSVVPSFAGAVTAIAAQCSEWGEIGGATFKAAFESQVQDLQIGVDLTGAPAAIAGIAALTADRIVGVDPVLSQTDVSQVLSEMDVITAPRDVQVNPTIGAAASAKFVAEMQALGALGGTTSGLAFLATLTALGSGAKSGDSAALTTGLAAAFGLKGAAAAGAGGMGLIGTLLWGGGGIAGFGAGFGSIMSLAGFGVEHLATTILGLAGSLAGALTGAALLAAGALSILAVGMGSDMAVSMSAISDTKTLAAALTAITTAQLTYGKGSAQAAAATQALNVQMQLLGNTAGVAAELGLAKAINALNAFWDQATSGARVAFVGMVTPLLAIAYTYIPLIAKAATTNFGLITAGLKPVIAFLDGPATIAFQDLEDIFAARLPTALYAFSQGLQFATKLLVYLANQTSGGFMNAIANGLAYLNSPAGFLKVELVVQKLIGLFQTWFKFGKELFTVLVSIFSKTAGLGTAIITELTSQLQSLNKWINATGKNSLTTFFSLHRAEVIALIKALGDLFASFAKFYLQVAPFFIKAATDVLNGLSALFGFLAKNKEVAIFTGLLLDIGLLATKSATLRNAITSLGGAFTWFAGILSIPVWALGLIVLGVVGVIAILVESYIHFTAFRDFVNNVWGAIVQGVKNLVSWVEQLIAGIQVWLKTHWQQISDDASIAWNIISTFIKIVWEAITTVIHVLAMGLIPILQVVWSLIFEGVKLVWEGISTFIGTTITVIIFLVQKIDQLIGFLAGVWNTVTADVSNFIANVVAIFGTIWGKISAVFTGAATWLYDIGRSIIQGLINGVGSMIGDITKAIQNVVNIVKTIPVIGKLIGSPSPYFITVGQAISQGLAQGIGADSGLATSATQTMVSKVIAQGNLGLSTASINLSGLSTDNSNIASRLDRVISLLAAAPSSTAAQMSTSVDAKLGNVIDRHAKTSVMLARTGAG